MRKFLGHPVGVARFDSAPGLPRRQAHTANSHPTNRRQSATGCQQAAERKTVCRVRLPGGTSAGGLPP